MAKEEAEVPYFIPLIRAINNVTKPDKTDRVTLGIEARALTALHQAYEQDPGAYAHNAEGKLFDLFRKKGGTSGLAATITAMDDDNEEDDAEPRPRPSNPNPGPELPDLGPIAVTGFAARREGAGTVRLNSEIRAGANGLFVALGRKRSDEVIVFGTNADADQIEAVAANLAREDLPFLSPAVRVFVETVSTQSFPSEALPSSPEKRRRWLREKYADPTEVREKGRVKKGLSERLVFVSGNQVTLSGAGLRSSVVTHCVAKMPLIADGENAALVTGELDELIRDDKLAYFSGDSSDMLRTTDAFCSLPYTDMSSGQRDALSLEMPGKIASQPDFARERLAPRWQGDLEIDWFATKLTRWVTPYFEKIGQYNHILRNKNKILGLNVTSRALTIKFNSATEVIPFPAPIAGIEQAYDAIFFSKDVAPVLFQLTRVCPVGVIRMAGNEHVLVFRYSTSVAEFEIAVPTVDPKTQVRDHTLFRLIGGRENGSQSHR